MYESYKKAYYNRAGAISSYEPQADGGLIIRDTVIMQAGAWTDMHGIDTVFSPEVLQRCAGQWNDTAVWTRHAGGSPRPVTEKVGAVLNPRYSPEIAAVVGDLLLHGKTDASRNAIALVQLAREAGGITDVSAETIVDLSPTGEVQDVIFTGLALVEDGACEVCRLPAFSKEETSMATKEEVKETVETVAAEPEAPAPAEAVAETLEGLLGRFVSQLIPEAGALIKSVQDSDGEAKAYALGRLAGCMEAYGLPEAPKEAPASEEVKEEVTDEIKEVEASAPEAQFERPQGLKGSLGAETKTITGQRQTVSFYGRDMRTAIY